MDPQIDGGTFFRLGHFLGGPDGVRRVLLLGFLLGALTWVPLLILTSWNGALTATSVPFLSSFGAHVRLLFSIPVLLGAEVVFDRRVKQVIHTLTASAIVPGEELPALSRALSRAVRWRDGWRTDIGLALLTAALVYLGVRVDPMDGISTWRRTPGGELTAAGWCYVLVGLPLFQFLLLRWAKRLLIWAWLLWRIRGLRLNLVATHPDLAGGLGPLAVVQLALSPLGAVVSATIVAGLAEALLHGTPEVHRVVWPLVAAVLGNTAALIAPLLFFAPRLLELKQQALLEYGMLATGYTRAFEDKWLRAASSRHEPLLGSADVQSLADLSTAFDVIRRMRIVPIGWNQVLQMAGAAAIPALPLILFAVSLDDLIIRAVRTLLHV